MALIGRIGKRKRHDFGDATLLRFSRLVSSPYTHFPATSLFIESVTPANDRLLPNLARVYARITKMISFQEVSHATN